MDFSFLCFSLVGRWPIYSVNLLIWCVHQAAKKNGWDWVVVGTWFVWIDRVPKNRILNIIGHNNRKPPSSISLNIRPQIREDNLQYAARLGLEGGKKKVPMHLRYHYLSMMVINGIATEYGYWTFLSSKLHGWKLWAIDKLIIFSL